MSGASSKASVGEVYLDRLADARFLAAARRLRKLALIDAIRLIRSLERSIGFSRGILLLALRDAAIDGPALGGRVVVVRGRRLREDRNHLSRHSKFRAYPRS
jgi:hypothetical protein